MNSLIARAAAFLVSPEPSSAGSTGGGDAPCQTIALVALGKELALAARVVSSAASAQSGGRPVLVCSWCEPGLLRPKFGRATCVGLPGAVHEVRDAVAAACAGAESGPLIVAVASPRPAGLDVFIAGADALIVACSDEAAREVAELALSRARGADQYGGVLVLPTGLAARAILGGLPAGRLTRDAAALLATRRADLTDSQSGARHALA